jgi:hypothetical protein
MNALVRRMAAVSVSRARCCLSTLPGVTNQGTPSLPRTRLQYPKTQRKNFSTESTDVSNLTGAETTAVFTDGGEQFGMVLDTATSLILL